jgi:hypothetical protein
MTCSHCLGTGEINQLGHLDCVYCTAARERHILNLAVASLPPLPQADLLWLVYRLATMSSRLIEPDEKYEIGRIQALAAQMGMTVDKESS